MANKEPFDENSFKKQTEHHKKGSGAFTSEDWDELCQSISDLGAAVSYEVGRGLKEGLKELKKAQKELEKTQQNNVAVQQAKQSVRKATRKADRMAQRFSDSVKNGLLIFSGVISMLCAWGCGIAALSVALAAFSQPGDTGYWIAGVIILCVTFGFGALGNRCFSLRSLRVRRRRYLESMGEQTVAPLEHFSNVMQRPTPLVRKDLRMLIKRGWLLGSYLDEKEQLFYRDIKEYYALQEQQKAQPEPQPQPQPNKEQPAQPQEQTILQQGKQFLATLQQHIKATEQDLQIHQELCRMYEQTEDLLEWLQSHPECTPKLRKFARYYMPTILKLLDRYDEVKSQQGDVADRIRLEIAGILHTLNIAFENLRDELLSDAALDISTEISAMQSMLAQDGFSLEDNFYPKE